MSELEKALKNVLLGGVGAVATAVEKTGAFAKKMMDKGAKVLEDNKDKTDALKQKSRETLDGIGARFSELAKRVRAQFTPEQKAPEAEADTLREELNELDDLEVELRDVEEMIREAPAAETPAADPEPEAPEAKTAESAADALGEIAGKAVEFLNSEEFSKTADHLAEESDKFFRKVSEAIDGAIKPPAELPDTESILQDMQRRLNDFAKRLENSRKAMEERDKKDE